MLVYTLLYSSVHWTSHVFSGTRNTRTCITGHPVYNPVYAAAILVLIPWLTGHTKVQSTFLSTQTQVHNKIVRLFLCVIPSSNKSGYIVDCRCIVSKMSNLVDYLWKYKTQIYRVVCPNFGHPALTSQFQVHALCRSCRHATRIINYHFKAEMI